MYNHSIIVLLAVGLMVGVGLLIWHFAYYYGRYTVQQEWLESLQETVQELKAFVNGKFPDDDHTEA